MRRYSTLSFCRETKEKGGKGLGFFCFCLRGADFSGDEYAHQRWPFWGVHGQAGWAAALDVGGDALRSAGGQCQRLPGPLYLQWHHSRLPWTGSQEHAKEYPPQH